MQQLEGMKDNIKTLKKKLAWAMVNSKKEVSFTNKQNLQIFNLSRYVICRNMFQDIDVKILLHSYLNFDVLKHLFTYKSSHVKTAISNHTDYLLRMFGINIIILFFIGDECEIKKTNRFERNCSKTGK